MSKSVLAHVQEVIAELKAPGIPHVDAPNRTLIALKMAEARIRKLEEVMAFGPELRAEMASHMMPQLFASSHPDDIIKSANVAVAATDALIEALQR